MTIPETPDATHHGDTMETPWQDIGSDSNDPPAGRGDTAPPGTIRIARGRRAPFTQIGDWVPLSGVGDRAVALYCRLAMHVNTQRNDSEVWPGQDVLAELGGFGKPESVVPHIDELVVIGAITVEHTRHTSGMRARNRYLIHETPPEWYAGPTSLGQYYALRRERPQELDAWRKERRLWIASQTKALAESRKVTKTTKSTYPSTAGFGTPRNGGTPRPAQTPGSTLFAVPPETGVRTPPQRGSVPPETGVEQEELKQDEISLSPLPASSHDRARETHDERERNQQGENTPQAATAAAAVIDAYTTALKRPVGQATRAKLENQAAGWLDAGYPTQWLIDRARELAAKGWTDLDKHVERSKVPVPGHQGDLPPLCGQCDERTRHVVDDDGTTYRCPRCHPATALHHGIDGLKTGVGPIPQPRPGEDPEKLLNHRFIGWGVAISRAAMRKPAAVTKDTP